MKAFVGVRAEILLDDPRIKIEAAKRLSQPQILSNFYYNYVIL